MWPHTYLFILRGWGQRWLKSLVTMLKSRILGPIKGAHYGKLNLKCLRIFVWTLIGGSIGLGLVLYCICVRIWIADRLHILCYLRPAWYFAHFTFHQYGCCQVAPPVAQVVGKGFLIINKFLRNYWIWLKFTSKVLFGMATYWLDFAYCLVIFVTISY